MTAVFRGGEGDFLVVEEADFGDLGAAARSREADGDGTDGMEGADEVEDRTGAGTADAAATDIDRVVSGSGDGTDGILSISEPPTDGAGSSEGATGDGTYLLACKGFGAVLESCD